MSENPAPDYANDPPPGEARTCTMHGCTGRCGICTPVPSAAGALTWDDQVVTTELGGRELNVRIPAPLQGLAHGTPVRVTVEPVGRVASSPPPAPGTGELLVMLDRSFLAAWREAKTLHWWETIAQPMIRAALSAAERKGGRG